MQLQIMQMRNGSRSCDHLRYAASDFVDSKGLTDTAGYPSGFWAKTVDGLSGCQAETYDVLYYHTRYSTHVRRLGHLLHA